MGAQEILLTRTAYTMRAIVIAAICLAAIACAELTPEDSMVTDDFKVPEDSVPASTLAETETDIATSSRPLPRAGRLPASGVAAVVAFAARKKLSSRKQTRLPRQSLSLPGPETRRLPVSGAVAVATSTLARASGTSA